MATSSISKSSKPLYILGAGNIGLFFAGCMKSSLLDIEHPVRLLLRPTHRLHLTRDEQNKGVVHTSLRRKEGVHKVAIPADIIGQEKWKDPIHNLLLSTKAPDAAKALSSIKDRLAPSANVIIMTNGALAVKDELEDMLSMQQPSGSYNHDTFSQPHLILASTTHGVYSEGDMVVQAGEGQTFVEFASSDHNDHNDDGANDGANDPSLQIQNLIRLWNSSGLNVQSLNKEQMYGLQWKKLATNCAINPLTALLQCCNGALLENNSFHHHPKKHGKTNPTIHQKKLYNETQQIMNDIIKEVSDVAILSSPYNNNDELTFDSLTKFVHDVIQKTAKNKSSMLQDVLRKRQPTEINYLNGYVAHVGQSKHGLPMTANTSICAEVQKLL